jgi:hypothetical protein
MVIKRNFNERSLGSGVGHFFESPLLVKLILERIFVTCLTRNKYAVIAIAYLIMTRIINITPPAKRCKILLMVYQVILFGIFY